MTASLCMEMFLWHGYWRCQYAIAAWLLALPIRLRFLCWPMLAYPDTGKRIRRAVKFMLPYGPVKLWKEVRYHE